MKTTCRPASKGSLEPVKVVSTNKAASQITVDGGDWSDGSGVPSDQNQDEVWTNLSTIGDSQQDGSSRALSNVYNGDTSTGVNCGTNGKTGVTLSGVSLNCSTGVDTWLTFVNGGGTNNGIQVTINEGLDSEVTQTISLNTLTPTKFTTAFNGTIQTINVRGLTAFNTALFQIEVDGKVLVDPTGARNLSAGPFTASGEYVSHDDTTLELTNAAGRWCVDEQNIGLNAVSDDEYTDLGVDPDNARFTSANGVPLTPEFSGELTNFESRIWSIASSADGNTYGAFTDYTDTSVASTQTGATEWQPPGGTLVNDTYYKAKVAYTATGAANVESADITFKTAPAARSSSGAHFYDSRTRELIRESDLINQYGTDEALPDLGIYELSVLDNLRAQLTALEAPTETPIAVSGYYPLYESEDAANAAGDGTSHTHVFNSTTYYMPNGVTFYHGNYGTNSY